MFYSKIKVDFNSWTTAENDIIFLINENNFGYLDTLNVKQEKKWKKWKYKV